MNKIITILFLFFYINSNSQTVQDYINKNAINCSNLSDTNITLYNCLKKFKCISVGEMHGTSEPAAFVLGLAKTFVQNNKKVIIGLEIENKKINFFSKTRKIADLEKSIFFNDSAKYGRNSEACYNLIFSANKINSIDFCFFDSDLAFDENRDSTMAFNIIKRYEADTNSVIITLSGNIHNMILPYNNKKTMGCYLKNYFKNKYFSITNLYGGGTMHNNTGNSLKINTVEKTNSIFDTATHYNNYFLVANFQNYLKEYNGIIYTKTITASLNYKK